jgi:hypothetical protein
MNKVTKAIVSAPRISTVHRSAGRSSGRWVGLVALATFSTVIFPAHAEPTAPTPSTTTDSKPVTPAPIVEPFVTRRTVAIVAAGVALAGTGVGAVFGALALQNKSDYDKNPTYGNSDRGNDDAAYADGAIALAVAAGVTSLVLFLTSDASNTDPSAEVPHERSASFSTSPFVTAHGGGAVALVRF